MVKIPRPSLTQAPQLTPTIDVPMAELDAIEIQIQQSNTPQQLPAHPNRESTLHALAANAATIYMGGKSVNAKSFPLNPGAAQDTHVDNLNKIWIFGTAGDKLSIETEWGIGEF